MSAVEVAPLRTERLELRSVGPAAMAALVEGRREDAATKLAARLPPEWPDAHDLGFLRLRLGQLRQRPEHQEWSVRAMVLTEKRLLVGHLGFHGPPGVNALSRADAVEIGYQVFPPHRSQGYGREAVEALISWAHEERGIDSFVASVSPGNEPSLRIVRRLGFLHVGEHWDDVDGLEHEFLLFRRTSGLLSQGPTPPGD